MNVHSSVSTTRLAAIVAAFAFTAPSCDRDSKAIRAEPTAKILFVGRSADDPMWATACRLAENSRKTRGWVGVEMRIPRSGTPDAQRELLEAVQPGDWKAICILVNDPEAIASQVERLARSGTPVVLLGRDARATGRTVFCGIDEEEAGEAVANACIQGLAGNTATIGLVHGGEQDATARARLRGFRRRIGTTKGIEIIREIDCSGHELEARRLILEDAQKYPRIGAWVMLDDWGIRGAPADARVAGPHALIVFFTAEAENLAPIMQGAADAGVGIDYEQIIERGLTLASELARGGKVQVDTQTVHPIVLTRKTPPDELARRLGLPTSTAVSTRP